MSKSHPNEIAILYDNHDSTASTDEDEIELDEAPIKLISSQDDILRTFAPIEHLIEYASIGHLDGVRYCVETAQTNPNTLGLREKLALHEAISKGHHKIVQYLINHGVSIHHKGYYPKSPYLLNAVEAAQECGIKEIQDIIVTKLKSETIVGNTKAQNSINSLIKNVIKGNLTEVIRCVEVLGIDPNEYGVSRRLAINEAIYINNIGITKYLIKHGADIHKEGYHHGKNRHYDAFDASHNFGTPDIHQLVIQKLREEAEDAAKAAENNKPTSQVELPCVLFDFEPFTRARNER